VRAPGLQGRAITEEILQTACPRAASTTFLNGLLGGERSALALDLTTGFFVGRIRPMFFGTTLLPVSHTQANAIRFVSSGSIIDDLSLAVGLKSRCRITARSAKLAGE
jgi:hypothetical protein